MTWYIRRPRRRAYYCVGWTTPEEGVFQDVILPGGGIMRVLSKSVHEAALERAGAKLIQLERQSGRTQ